MKVLLKSSLRSSSVAGEDTFELVTSLTKMGAEVFLDPVDVRPPLPSLLASSLTKMYPSYFDLILHYVNPVDAGVSKDFARASGISVLWTSHDSTMLNKRIASNLSGYDAIVASDDNTYSALSEITDIPVGVVSPGFDSGPWSPLARTYDDDFVFSMVLTGDSHECPEIAIEAFHKLRDIEEFKYASLVIKTTPQDDLNMKLMESVQGLYIIKENWTKSQFRKLYKDTHVLLSPDKGGVRNKAAYEFMATGGTVIATDWSLNKSWLSRAYSYPLKVSMASKSQKDVRDKYATPDEYNLQELMVEVIQNKQVVKQKGQIAYDVIPSMLDWQKVIASLFETLNEIVPDEGAKLYDKYKRMTPVEEEKSPWKM